MGKGTLIVFARICELPPKQKGYYSALSKQGDRIWIRVERSNYSPETAVVTSRGRKGEILLNAIEV